MTDTVVRLRLIADASQLPAAARTGRAAMNELAGGATAAGNAARGAAGDVTRFNAAQEVTRQRLAGVNAQLGAMPNLLRQVGAGLSALGAVAVARELASLADEWTNLTSKLRLVTQGEANLVSVRSQLFDLSQRTRSELVSTAELFTRLTRATSTLVLSEHERLRITESINKAFQISGATTQEATAAVIQLSQGLASGTLRGEEFNSVSEQAPVLLDLVSKSLGVTRGELRKMANDGQITAGILTNALLRGSVDLDKQFSQMTLTIGGASTQLSNAWQQWVGNANEGVGASRLVAAAISGLAGNIDTVVTAVLLLASAYGVRFVASIGAALIAKRAALAQAVALTAAEVSQARAAESAAAAELTHARSLAIMGGSSVRATEAQGALALAQARTAAATQAHTVAVAAQSGMLARFGSGPLALVGGPIGAVALGLAGIATAFVAIADAHEEQQRIFDAGLAQMDVATKKANELHTALTQLSQVPPPLGQVAQQIASNLPMLDEQRAKLRALRDELYEIEQQLASGPGYDTDVLGMSFAAGRAAELRDQISRLSRTVDDNAAAHARLSDDLERRLAPAMDLASSAADRLQRSMDLGSVLLSLGEGFQAAYRGIRTVTADAGVSGWFDDLAKRSKDLDDKLKTTGKTSEQLASQFVATGVAMAKEAGLTSELIGRAQLLGAEYIKKAAALDKASKSQREGVSEAEKYLEKLRDQVTAYGLSERAALRNELSTQNLTAAQRAQAQQLVETLTAWDKLKAVVDASARAWETIADGNAELQEELAKVSDQLAGLSPAQIAYNAAIRETNRLMEEALAIAPQTVEQQQQLEDRLRMLAELRAKNNELDKRQAISAGEVVLQGNLAKTNAEYAKRNALLAGNRDLSAALAAQADQLSARTTAQANYNAGVREANDLAERAIALGFEQADVQDALFDRLEKLAELRDGENLLDLASQFGDDDTFRKLVEDIRQVETAIDDAIGDGATEKAARLQDALGNMRHAMVTGIVDSSQAALRSMQSMTKDGSRAFQAMEIAIQALTVVQAISAVLNQAQGDPYTAFARMAAMAAAVASLGVSIGGFASSGFTDTAAQRQEQQGTGTVLGDAEAKSESIANATEITAEATSQLVTINRGMLYALQALGQALGAAAVQLARGAGDADFSAMSLATKPFDFKDPLTNWLLGGSSRVTDQGLSIGGGSLNDLMQNVNVRAYQEVQSRSWAFGSRRTRTGFVDVPEEFENQFQLIIGSIADTVREGALALGMLPAEVEAALAAFNVEAMTISLQGLTADEQQAELEAVFSALFDDLAGSVVPFISQFQQVGEGLGETLVRVATEVQVMQQVFEQLGIAVDMTNPERFAQLADGIVQAAGGLDEAQRLFEQFRQNFYSAGERTQLGVTTMVQARDEQLADLGLKPMTKDEFRAAFEAIMPSLTPAQIVEWLRVGELVAAVEDTIQGLMEKFREAFYTPEELLDYRATSTRATSTSLLAGLGLDTNTTMEQFRALFEQRLPTLSEESIVQWLRAAQALATATSAEKERNRALEQAQQQYSGMVSALQAELFGSDFTNAIAAIDQWEQQAIAGLNAAAIAAGRTGAAESDLALVRDVATQRIRAAINQLLMETRELVDQFNDVAESTTSWSGGMVDQIGEVAAATDDLYRRQMDGLTSIQRYLDEMLLGDLSGLSPQEQLDEARRQLMATQAAALAGDPEALSRLPQLADTYLRMFRQSTASGGDFRNDPFGQLWVRGLLQDVVVRGPTASPGSEGGGTGGGLTPAYLDARDQRIAEQEARHRYELALNLARHLGDLAGALRVPVLELMEAWDVDLRELVDALGIDLRNITGEAIQGLATLASSLGIGLGELTAGLGLQLTDLGAGLTELTTSLGINFDNLTGVQLEALTSLASGLGLSLTEIVQALGLNLTDLSEGVLALTSSLGIDLQNLTVQSTQSLGQLAQRLGVDLSELAQSVGVDLGSLADSQSLLNQGLAATINTLPGAQRDLLAPLLQAVVTATSDADANAAIAALEAATNDLPPAFRNQLAPYLEGVFPASAQTQLDYLSGIYDYAASQVDVMGEVRDAIRLMGQGQGLPGFAIGTAQVPYDMAAMIHRDEMIIDPASSRVLRQYGIGVQIQRASAANDDGELVAEVRALRAEIEALRATTAASGDKVAGSVRAEGEARRRQAEGHSRQVVDAMDKRTRGHG